MKRFAFLFAVVLGITLVYFLFGPEPKPHRGISLRLRRHKSLFSGRTPWWFSDWARMQNAGSQTMPERKVSM